MNRRTHKRQRDGRSRSRMLNYEIDRRSPRSTKKLLHFFRGPVVHYLAIDLSDAVAGSNAGTLTRATGQRTHNYKRSITYVHLQANSGVVPRGALANRDARSSFR